MSYFFLPLDLVFKIHQDLIETYGGAQGLRDKQLLISALAQVESTFDGNYLHESIYEMGAAYLFHIVQNHPFVDGNKRTGIALAVIFLSLHGVELKCEEKELDLFVFKVADGKKAKKEITIWFETNTRKVT